MYVSQYIHKYINILKLFGSSLKSIVINGFLDQQNYGIFFIWSQTTSQPFSPFLHSWLSEIRGGLTVCVSISSHFLHAWLVSLCFWRRRQFNSHQKRLLVLLYDNLTSSCVGEVSVLATDRAGRLREFIFLSSDWVLVTWESSFSCSLHSTVIT